MLSLLFFQNLAGSTQFVPKTAPHLLAIGVLDNAGGQVIEVEMTPEKPYKTTNAKEIALLSRSFPTVRREH